MSKDELEQALKDLRKRFERYKKKSTELHRLDCGWRSKDHHVFVCDKDGGPVRCNRETADECPYCIVMKEI